MRSVAVHITIPEELLKEIDRQAEREHRNRSEILREAVRRYLEEQRRKALEEQRLQQLLRALEESAGSWKDKDHPELRDIEGVRRLREEIGEGDQKQTS